MKKLMFLMMALLVAPAMADVTISIVDNGDLTADIVMTATDDDADGASSLVAGIALDVSVANGVITDVSNFMADGVSTAAIPGYGIFLGTITFTGGTPEAILAVGTPVAPDTAPDSPGQLGTAAIVLEFGGLYDVGVPGDAPLAVTTLCTIAVSEPTDLTLGANATRGGVVIIGGGDPSSTNLPVSGAVTDGGCNYTGPDYDEWVLVGKPESWCNQFQSCGDSDGLEEILAEIPLPGGGVLTIYNPVGLLDAVEFAAAYEAADDSPIANLACDLDHAKAILAEIPLPGGGVLTIYTRTNSDDAEIFARYYLLATDSMPPGNPACLGL